jgi:hypothetical protein
MTTNYSFNYWLSLIVFIAHIIGNLIVTKPNVELFTRLEKLTLFPPGWVFGIWFVIWTFQSILFYKTFGSEFWNNHMTLFFVLVCIGNLGSQYAGANNLGWLIYILLIMSMLLNSIFLLKEASSFYSAFPISKLATQLYVGWASLAFVVGVGVILVTDQEILSDKVYTIIGTIILVSVPIAIWAIWFKGKGDYRIVTIPYFLLFLAFALRLISRG